MEFKRGIVKCKKTITNALPDTIFEVNLDKLFHHKPYYIKLSGQGWTMVKTQLKIRLGKGLEGVLENKDKTEDDQIENIR